MKKPFSIVKKIVNKLIIENIKYRSGNDYKVEQYWSDRFKKYGIDNLQGAGDEGISPEKNLVEYKNESNKFIKALKKIPDYKNKNYLDIGTGNGFYAKILFDLGIKKYTGIDITDVNFSEFRKKFKNYNFIKSDLTKKKIEKKYDVVLLIDVIEHIVTKEKLNFALNNINNCVKSEGYFILTGFSIKQINLKVFFYNKIWSIKFIKSKLQNFVQIGKIIPYRGNNLIVLKKQ